jgi:hypothetical protein
VTFLSKEFADACARADAAASVDRSSSRKPWSEGLITAAALQTKQFKPVRIILPDLIPEGMTILAGKPKVGKSWFALDVCLAAADENRFVLGDKRPVHGDVLYLALEDNQRRLKKRLDKIIQGQGDWPPRLALRTEWKRFNEGGLEDIEAWCKSVEEPRLIWIDTLAKVRPLSSRNEPAYDRDYRAIEGLQKLAGQYPGLGIVINHHLRKASSEDDVFDDVSGTLGLTGAADTIIVMKRHSGMMKIHVRGRDIEEAEFAAEFNRCRWRLVGEAEEVFRSQERQAIVAALKDAGNDEDGNPKPMSVAEIMTATERTDRHGLDQMLYRMRKASEINSVGRGYYALPGADPLSTGGIGEKGASGQVPDTEAIDSASICAMTDLTDESHRDLTGTESGEIAVTLAETPKPLANNGNPNGSHHLTDLTRTLRADPWEGLDIPDSLRRAPRVVPPDRPALGPLGDRLDDLK